MRILAFSDLHGDARAARLIVSQAESADVLVGAGDYGTHGTGGDEVLEIILAASRAPVVLVHGNHDDATRVKTSCAASPVGHYLHGNAVELGGVALFGLGGEIPWRTSEPWNEGESEAAAESLLAGSPPGAILVTHSPPFGTADDQQDGRHDGSTAIRESILAKRPVLHLCGHIHHAWGTRDRLGPTRVCNLGPSPTWIEV